LARVHCFCIDLELLSLRAAILRTGRDRPARASVIGSAAEAAICLCRGNNEQQFGLHSQNSEDDTGAGFDYLVPSLRSAPRWPMTRTKAAGKEALRTVAAETTANTQDWVSKIYMATQITDGGTTSFTQAKDDLYNGEFAYAATLVNGSLSRAQATVNILGQKDDDATPIMASATEDTAGGLVNTSRATGSSTADLTNTSAALSAGGDLSSI
jgi:hypothetical protein